MLSCEVANHFIHMEKIKFTTYEKYQFLYIERNLNRKLSDVEKVAISWKFQFQTVKPVLEQLRLKI